MNKKKRKIFNFFDIIKKGTILAHCMNVGGRPLSYVCVGSFTILISLTDKKSVELFKMKKKNPQSVGCYGIVHIKKINKF
jgi:hypothetical protein